MLERHSIPIAMVSLGASEINVTFVVDEAHVQMAAQVLHEEFFSEK
jgi:aspartokinase